MRVDTEARKEADQPAADTATAPGLWDEEIFVAQLHRRARALNDAFQERVRRVLRRRELSTAFGLDREFGSCDPVICACVCTFGSGPAACR